MPAMFPGDIFCAAPLPIQHSGVKSIVDPAWSMKIILLSLLIARAFSGGSAGDVFVLVLAFSSITYPWAPVVTTQTTSEAAD